MTDSLKLSASVDALPAGTLLGDYVVRRKIGEGGFAVVYEGEHRGLRKRVAIKVLQAQATGSADVVQRFLREGEAAARLEHPNVVQVVHVGVAEGTTPFLVMEYLDGDDLAAHLGRCGKLSATELADIMVPVLSAVSAAHESGIVHRDLKPDNIFLCQTRRGRLVPKVLDFGISKVTSGGTASLNLTASDAILGTPYYMSPEQAQGSRTVDWRSDIFALGVILYQAATGRRPFTGESLYSVLTSIVVKQPPPPSEVSIPFEPELEALILRALRKAPEERFQSVREMGAALLPLAGQSTRINYEPDFDQAHASVTPAPSLGDADALEALSDSSPLWREGRARYALLGALLALALLVAGGTTYLRAGEATDAAPPSPAPVEAAPAPPVPAAVASPDEEGTQVEGAAASPAPVVETRKVALVARPAHATLQVDGEPVGQGSVTLSLPDDGAEHVLRVHAEGYEPQERTFTASAPPPRVVLTRIAPARRGPRGTSAASRAVRAQPAAAAKPAASPIAPVAPAKPAAEPAPPPPAASKEPAPTPERGANNALILR